MKLCAERTDRFFFKMGNNISGINGGIHEESKKLGGSKDDDSDTEDSNTDSENDFRSKTKDKKDCSKNKLVFQNDVNVLNKVEG